MGRRKRGGGLEEEGEEVEKETKKRYDLLTGILTTHTGSFLWPEPSLFSQQSRGKFNILLDFVHDVDHDNEANLTLAVLHYYANET